MNKFKWFVEYFMYVFSVMLLLYGNYLIFTVNPDELSIYQAVPILIFGTICIAVDGILIGGVIVISVIGVGEFTSELWNWSRDRK